MLEFSYPQSSISYTNYTLSLPPFSFADRSDGVAARTTTAESVLPAVQRTPSRSTQGSVSTFYFTLQRGEFGLVESDRRTDRPTDRYKQKAART